MNCSVCKQKFIISTSKNEYNIQQRILEEELMKYVDKMFDTDSCACWSETMRREAMLLLPEQKPNFCPA